jgi:hypothetical protein
MARRPKISTWVAMVRFGTMNGKRAKKSQNASAG